MHVEYRLFLFYIDEKNCDSTCQFVDLIAPNFGIKKTFLTRLSSRLIGMSSLMRSDTAMIVFVAIIIISMFVKRLGFWIK